MKSNMQEALQLNNLVDLNSDIVENTLDIRELLKSGKRVDYIRDIPLSESGLYLLMHDSIGMKSTKIDIVSLYSISHKIGVINSQFHFDVADTYINVRYIRLEGCFHD